ncbi:MAG: neutral zinc metallopeptidase [Prevotella sp.]|nr:neutral zinc metallopeptidase [Prevotella sp.]MBQ6209355.1 neutral zinc metallopeptidase [Prevotella sp.]
MRLDGRRESENVEDRRGMSSAAKAGIGGIGGIIMIALFTLLSGGNIGDVVTNVVQNGGFGEVQEEQLDGQREFTEEEQRLAKLSRQVLAGTEDVWTAVFQQMGRKYTPPTLVLFTNRVNSACGTASAAVGPFYCSGDQKLYIDLSFFTTMKQQIGADGDFSYAYVIAHEVGHHVENLLGTLGQAHAKMNQVNQVSANKISVRLELLADYYAGVWAHYDNQQYKSLEEGDIEKAIDCAQKIGDNYLQKKAQGYVQPESFTHGTSAQRMRWLKRGIDTGNMNTTTFNVSESEL